MNRPLAAAAAVAALFWTGQAQAREFSPRIREAERIAEKGDFAGSLKIGQAVLRDAEASGDRLLEAEAAGSVGGSMIGVGQMMEAGPFLERALRIREALLGPDDPRTLYSVNDYGLWLSFQGRDAEAGPLLARAAEGLTRQARTPDEKADAAEARAGHATVLFTLGEWEKADAQMLSAMEVLRTHPGKELSYLNALTLLADNYVMWGRYADAVRYGDEGLALRETLMGPNHPHAIGVLNLLGLANLSLGNQDTAERHYQRAVDIAQAAFPEGGIYVGHALGGLANFYAVTGREDEAILIYRRAAEANAKLGEQSWRAAENYRMLAQTLSRQGRYDEALPLAEQAIRLYDSTRGPQSEYAGQSRMTLARIHYDRGDDAAGERYAREALAIYEKVLTPDNPRLADAVSLAAEGAAARGDHAEAKALYARAVAIQDGRRPGYHPALAGARASEANQLLVIGTDPREAWLLSRRASADLQQAVLSNARLIGRGGAPNLSSSERNAFYISVRTAWSYAEALDGGPREPDAPRARR